MSRVPSNTTVAVLLGGWSAEREVSLSSGKSCTAALQRAGFKVVKREMTATKFYFSRLLEAVRS